MNPNERIGECKNIFFISWRMNDHLFFIIYKYILHSNIYYRSYDSYISWMYESEYIFLRKDQSFEENKNKVD